MFKVTVDEGKVHISGKNSIENMMLGVTMTVRSIWECDGFDEDERDLFKRYVQEELGHLAFVSEDEAAEKVEEINKEEEKAKKAFEESRKNLVEIIGEEKVKKLEDVLRAIFS